MTSKMGRPTNNPRNHKLAIRLNDEEKKMLDDYCKREQVTKTEAISRGIKKLEE